MTDAQRLTILKIAAASVVGLFLLDRIVITPAMGSWNDQSQRIEALRQKVARGQELIERQDAIRARWAQMVRANLPPEVSAAENEAVQAIYRWQRTSGITFASLSPQWQTPQDGYDVYECRATLTGSQVELGRFIYELESDPIPVNLEEFEITSRDDRGATLTMTARFTFLRMDVEGSTAQ